MLLRGSIYSKALEMETGLTVFFPKNIQPGRKLRSVYLLHGICGSNASWAECTMLPVYAADYDAAIIMPDGARSLYTDMKYGQKYFTYISQELPELCAGMFNISASREDTAVIGGSAGGYGALRCALAAPERFSVCCALSSSFLFFGEAVRAFGDTGRAGELRKTWGEQLPADFLAAFGEGLQVPDSAELLALARGYKGQKPDIYLSCGTEDPFYTENVRFAGELQKLGFSPVFEPLPGTHDWYFFDRVLKRGLEYCFR